MIFESVAREPTAMSDPHHFLSLVHLDKNHFSQQTLPLVKERETLSTEITPANVGQEPKHFKGKKSIPTQAIRSKSINT